MATCVPDLPAALLKQIAEAEIRYYDYRRSVAEGWEKKRAQQAAEAKKQEKKAEPVAEVKKPAPAPAPVAPTPAKKEEDDIDLFGDDDDEETKAAMEAKKKELEGKKKAKPAVIAKSSIVLDVKPWEAETDLKALEAAVRAIEMEGLLWGASKFLPVAYGVKKLQIMATIVDDLVSVDELEERITSFEDLVQSVDVVAFNKI
eukprot:CAMPEP_0196655252 /NCGR_PEP_ID=MMETSP1086-20130531/5003_1 /TAXON_ID=77921 /ORGANISM="Cyanoptyche  gloeocystis , Strain SAG4.97" /LENGTH=201 /DNA_ID=CAMNT_0041987461 /DNA_START=78 /DNA_END=683 /DNA_ORIENTATION=+